MGALQASIDSAQPSVSLLIAASRGFKSPSSFPPRFDVNGRRNSHSQDWHLVQLAIAGDRGSQDLLFARHTGRLRRIAFNVLRNRQDAEDAVQEGLCRAYIKLRSFQGRSSLSTWLTRVVINSALMIRRRRRARPEAPLNEILENQQDRQLRRRIVDQRPNPEQTCGATEISKLIENEVRRLPAGIRSAYQLCDLQGLSSVEAMRALGIGRNAFKSRILRARKKLRQALQSSIKPRVRTAAVAEADPPKCQRSRHTRTPC